MKSLKTTILVSFIAVILWSCISIFFVSARYSRLTLKDVYRDDIFTIQDRIDNIVNHVLTEELNAIDYIADLPLFRSEEIPLAEKQASLNQIIRENSSHFMSVNFLDQDGNVQMAQRIISYGQSPIFKQVMSTNTRTIIGPMVNNVNNQLTLNLGVPVKNFEGKTIGMILALIKGDFLCDISKEIKIGETGTSIIIDRLNGNTIGAPKTEDVISLQNIPAIAEKNKNEEMSALLKKAIAGEKGWGNYYEGRVKKVILYQPISNTNWSVVTIANDMEIIKKLHTMETIIFTVTVIAIVLGLLVALGIARALNPLKHLGNAITDIASGNADLTKRLNIKKPKKEIADVVNGFNSFCEKLQTIIQSLKTSNSELSNADVKLQESTQDTAASITQIIENINSVGKQISTQANSVSETASAVNEIASNIESLENMIGNQSNDVAQASSAIEEMIGNINSVNSSVEKMVASFTLLEQNAGIGISTQADVNEKIRQIEEQSQMLQDANTAIASIAEQTNLLAMNAAIEAAHAGESGKGFSVVADEIRKLSETSTAQSKTIGDELNKIKDSIGTVVDASDKAAQAFNSVNDNIVTTNNIIEQIKAAMEEQQIGSKQIITALTSMNDSTTEVKAASAEMTEGNKQILSEINRLQQATDIMKGSISEMSAGAQKINETGTELSTISKKVTTSIIQIGDEIDQFRV